MPSKPLAPKAAAKQCDDATVAFVESQMGVVQRDDVGPLLGALTTLCRATRSNSLTRRYWAEATSVALADDPRTQRSSRSRLQWTAAVTGALLGAALAWRTIPTVSTAHKRAKGVRRPAR